MSTGDLDTAAATERDRLSAGLGILLRRISRWNTAGWAVRVGDHASDRARVDVVFELVQTLADAAAAGEGRPARAVPRIDHNVLPDQLTVMAHDVLATGSVKAIRASQTALDHANTLLSASA